jgi:hypothetical protein
VVSGEQPGGGGVVVSAEAVSRNHECAGLDDLVELAEGYLEEGQPIRLKLGEVYDRLERPPP